MIPLKRFEVTTHQPYDAVQAQLDEMIKQGWTSREGLFKRTDKPFYGSVERGAFKARRTLRYRNNVQPVLHGTLTDEGDRRKIAIEMKLPITLLLLVVVVTIFLFVIISTMVTVTVETPLDLLLGVGLPISFIVLILAVNAGLTLYEVNKAERVFRERFNVHAPHSTL